MNAKLKKPFPNIYFLDFENRYDLAMTFLRVQEFYENPNPDFYRKTWPILDFMEWYAKTQSQNNCFSYPYDWVGFNVPSFAIDFVLNNVPDPNKYDKYLSDVVNAIKLDTSDKFYLIGSVGYGAFNHEIAHGLYYTNPDYHHEMNNELSKLDESIKNDFLSKLSSMMYHESVLLDEAQAYLSTGLCKIAKNTKISSYTTQFKEIYEKYTKNHRNNT